MRGYRRLMRWYPASWRVQHEEFMLDTLRERAESSGGHRTLRGEAWSMRLHGLGERLSLRLASALSLAALAVLTVAGVQRVALPPAGIWMWLGLTFSVAVGPTLLSVAVIAMLRSRGVFSSPAAVGVSVVAIVAWSLALVTALSWSIGFDEADAGVARTLLGNLFVPLFLASCLAGTAVIAPICASRMMRIRPQWARWLLAILAAAVTVVPVGLGSISPVSGIVVSIVLFVVAQRLRGETRARRVSPPFQPRPLTRGIRRRIVGLAIVSGSVGLLSVSFALTGSFWTTVTLDGTQAMNLGLATGSLAAIPVAVAGGIAMTRHHGARFWAPTLALIAALAAVSAGQFAGAGHPLQWPLILAAGACLGIGAAFVFSRLLPGGRMVRLIAMVGISMAVAVSIGLVTAMLLPVVAPLVAIAVVVWAIRSGTATATAA